MRSGWAYWLGGCVGAKVAGRADLDSLCVGAADISFAAHCRLGCVLWTVESWQTRNRDVGGRTEVSMSADTGREGLM